MGAPTTFPCNRNDGHCALPTTTVNTDNVDKVTFRDSLALMAVPLRNKRANENDDEDNVDMGDKINLFVRFLPDKSFCLSLNPRVVTVGQLYDLLLPKLFRLQQEHPQPATTSLCRNLLDVYLVCNGKILHDTLDSSRVLFLSDYGLTQNNTVIYAHVRLRGGCFIFSCSILGIIFLALCSSFFTCGLSLVVIPILIPFLFVLPFFGL